jgi:hypothetical protein
MEMELRRRLFALAVPAGLVALAAPAAARPSIPLVDYDNEAIGRQASEARVRAAILSAAQGRKWTVADQGPGHLVGTLVLNNKHTMRVDIRFTTTSLSLNYKDSINLNYMANAGGARWIHPAYNREVEALLGAIRSELHRAV